MHSGFVLLLEHRRWEYAELITISLKPPVCDQARLITIFYRLLRHAMLEKNLTRNPDSDMTGEPRFSGVRDRVLLRRRVAVSIAKSVLATDTVYLQNRS